MLRALTRLRWKSISAEEYARAYALYGGSVITHPAVIAAYSDVAGLPLRYRGISRGGELVAALPAWGRHVAGHRRVLKRLTKSHPSRQIDTGRPEVILPVAEGVRVRLGHRVAHLSVLNATSITNSRLSGVDLAMARPHRELSRKSRETRRRELRAMEKAGVSTRPVTEYPPDELTRIYFDLFRKRWGFEAIGQTTWPAIVRRLSEYMTGFVLELGGHPVAVQLLIMAESPGWISVEFINGGVDPDYAEYTPGTVLTYLNTAHLEERAASGGKRLRYSFGVGNRGYKERWCQSVPLYRV
jgi:hypothetical protein